MITRMEIHHRSKEPCIKKPAIFTTGGYRVCICGREYHFDFEDMQASTEIVDSYLHIHAVQCNFEKSLFDGYTIPTKNWTMP